MLSGFQFTRPRGARQADAATIFEAYVSIHAPTRGATFVRETPLHDGRFQFTRPRGARRVIRLRKGRSNVSIHAPTRGATPDFSYAGIIGNVSIHAPTRGATR